MSAARSKPTQLFVSCEHGGNRVPAAYRRYFSRLNGPLTTHRGYDRGALQLARHIAAFLDAPLRYSLVTRLLVDLNRSVSHRNLHSEAIACAPQEVKEDVLRRFYLPYRAQIERDIAAAVRRGRRAVHISCHSFTPRLNGSTRRAGIGLLYDPARPGERALCKRWRSELEHRAPGLRVRFNYPYRGSDDGLTTHLRRRFSGAHYLGIEIEVNQSCVASGEREWRRLRTLIARSLERSLQETPARPRAPSPRRAGTSQSRPRALRRTSVPSR